MQDGSGSDSDVQVLDTPVARKVPPHPRAKSPPSVAVATPAGGASSSDSDDELFRSLVASRARAGKRPRSAGSSSTPAPISRPASTAVHVSDGAGSTAASGKATVSPLRRSSLASPDPSIVDLLSDDDDENADESGVHPTLAQLRARGASGGGEPGSDSDGPHVPALSFRLAPSPTAQEKAGPTPTASPPASPASPASSSPLSQGSVDLGLDSFSRFSQASLDLDGFSSLGMASQESMGTSRGAAGARGQKGVGGGAGQRVGGSSRLEARSECGGSAAGAMGRGAAAAPAAAQEDKAQARREAAAAKKQLKEEAAATKRQQREEATAEKKRQKEEAAAKKKQEREAARLEKERAKEEAKQQRLAERQRQQQARGNFSSQEVACVVEESLAGGVGGGRIVAGTGEQAGRPETFQVFVQPGALKGGIWWTHRAFLKGGAAASGEGVRVLCDLVVVVVDKKEFVEGLAQRAGGANPFPALARMADRVRVGVEQLGRVMEADFLRIVLVLEGAMQETERRWRNNRGGAGGKLGSVADFKEAQAWLLVSRDLETQLTRDVEETGQYLYDLTRAMAAVPYREEVTELQCVQRLKTQASYISTEGLEEVERQARDSWVRALQTIPGMGRDKASALAEHYPLPRALARAVTDPGLDPRRRPEVLADKMGTGRNQSALSHRLHALFTAANGDKGF